jgi:bacillaene synthase trans-acting acyltransferase
VNFDRHFLVSCPSDRFPALMSGLKQHGIVASELPIQRALHSSLIDAARPQFEAGCAVIEWKLPAVPMFSPVRLEWVTHLDSRYFWEACREPVRFADAIQELERYGVSRFVDLGPSGTLANFVKYGLSASRSVTAINRLSRNSDSLAQLFRALGA